MPPYRTSRDETTPLPAQTPALKWAARIFITLFTLPFFAIGFSMIGGGGFLGAQGGAAGGFGFFGVLFGLAFISIPALMLLRVWTAKFSPTQGPGEATSDTEILNKGDAPSVPAAPASVVMQSCQYCGRPRPNSEPTCPACGAH